MDLPNRDSSNNAGFKLLSCHCGLVLHPVIEQAAYELYSQGIANGSLLLNALMPPDGHSLL
jgi:hypothetical protein